MGDGRPDELRYTAFLSYSHKDAAAAGRLHRRLETYRMPRRLIGTETARGPVPPRLWPIFRDREELPAATDLSETVREALAQSGALIILCSPAAAGSLWVAEEIETFRALHPGRPILAAILEGDPPDCFPQVLRAFGRDGTWHEPLATDLRKHRDGSRLGLLKLVAGITGVGLDALVQRDAARKIRRVMAVTGAAVVATLIMAALALVAINARGEAERQRAEAERQRAAAEGQIEFMLTDLRARLRGVGRLDIMTAVNQRALAYYGRQNLEEVSVDSLIRRARALQAMGEDDMTAGRSGAALAAFQEAHRTTASLLDRSPGDPDRIFAHSQSEFWVGRIPYARGDFQAAKRSFERYKALADRLLTINPNNPAWLREAGYAEGVLCTIAMSRPVDAATALRTCSAALARMERVHRLQGDDPAVIEDLANRHGWMVSAWNANNRWDRALEHQARHESLVRSLLRAHPENLNYRDIWMRSQFAFAQLLAARGERLEARRRLADAATTAAALRARDPDNASWRSFQRQIANATN